MSAPPYMKLYVADYLGDTYTLNVVEHGAYMLLLMGMWRAGGKLPADDAKLARIACCTPEQWAEVRATVLGFFKRRGSLLTHKRVSAEMAKYEAVSERRKEAGKRGGSKKANENRENSDAFAQQNESNSPHNQNHNQNQKIGDANASLSDRRDPTSVAELFEKPEGAAHPARRITPTKAELDAIWEAAPKLGRERSSRKDVERALTAAMRRGHEPADILVGVRAAYASTTYGGDHAKGVHRLIEADRWQTFTEAAVAKSGQVTTAATFANADLRSAALADPACGRDFVVGYLDRCRWVDLPTPTIIAPNGFIAERIRRDFGRALRARGVAIDIEPQTGAAA